MALAAPVLIMTSFTTELAMPSIADVHYVRTPRLIYKDSDQSVVQTQTGNSKKTRRTWAVHTSAKACVTSVTIRRHQNLIIGSSANWQPSLKVSCKSISRFFGTKLLTDRQTNNDDYISSLAAVMKKQLVHK